jgi:hypothetical protein
MSKAKNMECEYCGSCGHHKMSCPTQKVTVFLSKSHIANRKLKYGKGEAPKVKRSKDVEP